MDKSKFNKDLNQPFNMILFSHSEVYGGGLEAFAINLGSNTVWVHGNATEHLRELEINLMKDISKTPEAKRLAMELILTDFQGALKEATKNGLKYDTLINVGRWEFKLSAPRQTGQLPALIHAQPK